jgi:hypothetical protein
LSIGRFSFTFVEESPLFVGSSVLDVTAFPYPILSSRSNDVLVGSRSATSSTAKTPPLLHQLSVIRYFVLCEKLNQQILTKHARIYIQHALGRRAVQKWAARFRAWQTISTAIMDPDGPPKRKFPMPFCVSLKRTHLSGSRRQQGFVHSENDNSANTG